MTDVRYVCAASRRAFERGAAAKVFSWAGAADIQKDGDVRMRGVLAVATALAVCALPSSAWGCPEPSSETYVFFNVPPERIPAGLTLLKVRVAETGGLVKANLLERSTAFPQAGVEIDPGLWSSCSRWGPIEGDVYALGVPGEWNGKPVFLAVQLRRKYPVRRREIEIDTYIVDPAYVQQTDSGEASPDD